MKISILDRVLSETQKQERLNSISDLLTKTETSKANPSLQIQKMIASGALLLLQKNIRKSWHAVTQPFRKYYISVLIRI